MIVWILFYLFISHRLNSVSPSIVSQGLTSLSFFILKSLVIKHFPMNNYIDILKSFWYLGLSRYCHEFAFVKILAFLAAKHSPLLLIPVLPVSEFLKIIWQAFLLIVVKNFVKSNYIFNLLHRIFLYLY